MTDISPGWGKELTALDISEVSPTTITTNSLLKGLVAIKWPYSSSGQKLTFLLADEDIRKRAAGGQVRVTLLGEAATIVDQIESGEEVSIAPPNAGNVTVEAITEPRCKWHITFPDGCILQLKGQLPRQYTPPAPTKPIIATPLPRVPTPPLPEEPASQKGVWNTPLKRKFAELTDHSIASSLTDEEEWFGSEPKSGSQDGSRRFSGRMRFIGLDSPSISSSPQIKRLSDENSFTRTPQRSTLSQRTEVSPAVVLQAQNLVSAEILSEKLLHPPRAVGTGMDEMSHVAMQEGSLRPMSAGMGSNTGKRSLGERSFDVFIDEGKDVGAEDGMEDVLPAELTRPAQVGQWSVPAPSLPVSERQSPEVREEEESEVSSDSDFHEQNEDAKLPDVTRPDRQSLQLTDTPPILSAASSRAQSDEEGSEDDLDAYDASGQLIQPNQRRYYQPDQHASSEEEYSGSDDVGYGQPERYQDDEELSGQEFDDVDTLQHAGYYSQGRRVEDDNEFYHSEEEEYSDQGEYESEEEAPAGGKAPVVVDLTLDSSDDEQSEEEEEDDRLDLRGHTDEEPESEVEESEASEEEEEEVEEEVEEEDEPEWQGIKSQTPATPFTDVSHPSQEQITQTHPLDVFLDPSLIASHTATLESAQPHLFGFDPALQIQSEAIAQQDAPDFPPDLIAQALDPAMFQPTIEYHHLAPSTSIDTHTASIMETVLSFAQEQQAAMDTVYSMDVPNVVNDSEMMQDIRHQPMSLSEMMEDADAILHKHVENVDSTAQEEFLMGIMPMGDQETGEEAPVEMQRRMTQEFLPNIVYDLPTEAEEEKKVDDVGEKKVRHESEVVKSVGVHEQAVEELRQQETEVDKPAISVEQPTSAPEESELIVQEETIEVVEKKPEPSGLGTTTAIQEDIQEDTITVSEPPPPPPAQEQKPPEELEEQAASPPLPRSPSPPPLPEDWRAEGLTTPLAYFPPLADIVPPSLRAQKENRVVDVIGIVRTCGELARTKGVDYVLPLHIVDSSTGTDNGLSVLLFRPHKSALPENLEPGSVIILTDMKVQSFQHRAQVRTTESSGWILFPVSGKVVDSGPPVEYGDEERLMVKQLQRWWKRSLEKGKGKEKTEKNGVDGHVSVNGDNVNGAASGKGSANGKDGRNRAKRGGRKVNINRG